MKWLPTKAILFLTAFVAAQPDVGAGLAFAAGAPATAAASSSLEAGFAKPPRQARPLGWWHWINGNVTKDGIAADLEAAKLAGMGGVQLFDVEIYLPKGPVRYGTSEWHEHVQFAMAKAAELGLEFHVMNTPGWSASGGPWVTPELSMKRLVWSETECDGGEVAITLAVPNLKPSSSGRGLKFEQIYREVAVLAVPRTTERIKKGSDHPRKRDAKIGWGTKPIERPADDRRAGIPAEKVIDLTGRLAADGQLRAALPPGSWTILRFGYVSTGATNHPAVPEGHGLEVDKFDADAVAFYFEKAIGPLLKDANSSPGKTFDALLFDSFEGGFQNWTEKMPALFRKQRGYELAPWLPVFTGRIIESAEASEAVLWDFRLVCEELLAEHYFGTMKRLGAAHGLKLYSESQGGPLNPTSANRHIDVPMNEFWMPDALNRAGAIKQTVSAAAFFGRPVVAAEAFTATPEHAKYQNTPETLKPVGDLAFALGVNRFCFHSFTHQPVTAAAPGFSLGRYGTHFGRLNTWWPYASAWIEYVSRSQFLLQQGRTVADVCVLIDEDQGYATPANLANEAFPGHDFLLCYPPDLAEMTVADGQLKHPRAGRFRLLMLPDNYTTGSWVAQIVTLREIARLVKAGAAVAGDAPVAPAGLADLRQRTEFDRLVREIWGGLDGKQNTSKALGTGRVYLGMKPLEVLEDLKVSADLKWGAPAAELKFIHRKTDNADLYFVFNCADQARQVWLNARVAGRVPEFWDAKTGTRVDAPVYELEDDRTTVPVNLEPWGSMFLVFRKPLPPKWTTAVDEHVAVERDGTLRTNRNRAEFSFSDGTRRSLTLAALPAEREISGTWRVNFIDGRGAPSQAQFKMLSSWSENSNPAIRFYSGTAVYRTSIELPVTPEGCAVELDLGTVADIARVRINGKDAGVWWMPPFGQDVTRWLRAGTNSIEISVANRWINRIIGDEAVPVDYDYQKPGVSQFTDGKLLALPDWLYEPEEVIKRQRQRWTFCAWKHYTADSPLVPSGLLGPVTLRYRHVMPAQPIK